MTLTDYKRNLGQNIKQKRQSQNLTLHELSSASGVSPSHLGRIENGDRNPSAGVLQRIAKPLGFSEDELFTMAGYLSAQFPALNAQPTQGKNNNLDPYVANVLSQEPVEVQKAVIGILAILKSLANTVMPSKDPQT
jgi:transcriptional regulator with XRE-family HTH domain